MMRARILQMITVMITCTIVGTLSAQTRVLVFASADKGSRKSADAVATAISNIGKQMGLLVQVVNDTAAVNWKELEANRVFIQIAPESAFSPLQLERLKTFVTHEHGWLKIPVGDKMQVPVATAPGWLKRSFGGVVESAVSKPANAVVVVEDHEHPLTSNLPQAFRLKTEWPAFDKNPRANVRVLVSVDESSYHAEPAMGDHPVVWINENYARLMFFGIGSDPEIYNDPNCRLLVQNALGWLSSTSERAQ
jgi:uncharacterized protein